jgi:hypothetical protein
MPYSHPGFVAVAESVRGDAGLEREPAGERGASGICVTQPRGGVSSPPKGRSVWHILSEESEFRYRPWVRRSASYKASSQG